MTDERYLIENYILLARLENNSARKQKLIDAATCLLEEMNDSLKENESFDENIEDANLMPFVSFLEERISYKGRMTELLKEVYGEDYTPTHSELIMTGKMLIRYRGVLFNKYGILLKVMKNGTGGRFYELSKIAL